MVRIGGQDDDDAYLEERRNGLYEEVLGFEYAIRQIGVLKDMEQSINTYLDTDSGQFVEARQLVKQTLILSSNEVVKGVVTFRKALGMKNAFSVVV